MGGYRGAPDPVCVPLTGSGPVAVRGSTESLLLRLFPTLSSSRVTSDFLEGCRTTVPYEGSSPL